MSNDHLICYCSFGDQTNIIGVASDQFGEVDVREGITLLVTKCCDAVEQRIECSVK